MTDPMQQVECADCEGRGRRMWDNIARICMRCMGSGRVPSWKHRHPDPEPVKNPGTLG